MDIEQAILRIRSRIELAITLLWVLVMLVGTIFVMAAFAPNVIQNRLEDAGITQVKVIPGKAGGE